MKLVFTYTKEWDWYDALCIVFAGALCMWISKSLILGLWPSLLIGAVLGMLSIHMAAFLRPPPKD